MSSESILAPAPAGRLFHTRPAPFFTATPKALKHVLRFFTAQMNNDHTPKAYLNATRRFEECCAAPSAASPTCRPSPLRRS